MTPLWGSLILYTRPWLVVARPRRQVHNDIQQGETCAAAPASAAFHSVKPLTRCAWPAAGWPWGKDGDGRPESPGRATPRCARRMRLDQVEKLLPQGLRRGPLPLHKELVQELWHGSGEWATPLVRSRQQQSPGPMAWGFLSGAGDGNRTRALSLGSSCSTIKLHPRSGSVDQCRSVAHCTSFKALGVLRQGPFVHLRRFGRRVRPTAAVPGCRSRGSSWSIVRSGSLVSVMCPVWVPRGVVGAYLWRRSAAWSAVLLIP